MNSRPYLHPQQPPHPHQQQSHQQAHAGHPVAPYAAALQGQIGHRPVFQPNSQNAAGPQAAAAAAGPGSSAGQMMHPSTGQMVQNQVANQSQPQSYPNAAPQQAIRTAFGPQQPVPQNRPQPAQQMHQSAQQQHQQQAAQNAAAAAAAMQQQQHQQQQIIMFPNYGQHQVVQHMYPANAGHGQPVMSIPSSHIQAISVSHALLSLTWHCLFVSAVVSAGQMFRHSPLTVCPRYPLIVSLCVRRDCICKASVMFTL